MSVTGVILAGGRATRMGGREKGLIPLCGVPLIEHVIAALAPQVDDLIINANRRRKTYAAYGYAVVRDAVGLYWGPLAGVWSAMRVAKTDYILTVPCDVPFLPRNLARRMLAVSSREKADACVVHDGERIQPAFALLKRDLAPSLLAYLKSGHRKAENWIKSVRFAPVRFRQPLAFRNINTPRDLSDAEEAAEARNKKMSRQIGAICI